MISGILIGIVIGAVVMGVGLFVWFIHALGDIWR